MALTPEEMAAKAEEKRAQQEAAKAERAEKRAAEKAARKAEREASRMPKQNGIRRPRPDTKTGLIWAVLDERSTAEGRPVAISEVFADLVAAGNREATVRSQYAYWRKFHGITGRIENPNKAPKATKTPVETANETAVESNTEQ